MFYWNGYSARSLSWRLVESHLLPDGDKMLERCASYCLSYTGELFGGSCIAVTPYTKTNASDGIRTDVCYIVFNSIMGAIFPNSKDGSDGSDRFIPSVAVTAEYYYSNPEFFNDPPHGEFPESTCTDCTPWSSCSRSCGEGTSTRLVGCDNMTTEGCPASSVETKMCNEGPCPIWSDWSSWGGCSESCEGGTQTRTRFCLGAEESGCPGSASDDQQCNKHSCDFQMAYFYDHREPLPMPLQNWRYIHKKFLPDGDTMLEQCTSYCIADNECQLAKISIKYHPDGNVNSWIQNGELKSDWCFVTNDDFLAAITPREYGWSETKWHPGWLESGGGALDIDHYAITKEYFESNPVYFTTWHRGQYGQWLETSADGTWLTVDGVVGENSVELEGICDETNTDFGIVNYRQFGKIEFAALDDKNVIRESGQTNCATNCFEKAGCSAFFADVNGCAYIIGIVESTQNNNEIKESGMLSRLCPSNAFRSSYTARSSFHRYFYDPKADRHLVDTIVEHNTGSSNTPLHVWTFKTQTGSGSSMISSSQYVSLSMPKFEYGVPIITPVEFSIETHLRVWENPSDRKRRSIGDILADVEAIVQQEISLIVDGGIKFPDDIKVAATSPVEILEFVQTAADGSLAADCSSGTCKCSAGFIDNGNGCEQMTEEQAATTTQAPTTTQTLTTTKLQTTTKAQTTTKTQTTTPATTQSVSYAIDWIPSLIVKMGEVFELNRPGKPRYELMKKWQKLGDKYVKRFKNVNRKDCELFGSDLVYEDASVDFDSIIVCRVSFRIAQNFVHEENFMVKNDFFQDINQIEAAFATWGRKYTFDCRKVKRKTHTKWFDRNTNHVKRIADKTRKRLFC